LRSCTTVIDGKKTSTDGSILFAKSEDDANQPPDYFRLIPRKKYGPGEFITETGGLSIPQVSETWAHIWDQTVKMPFSNVIINEWGVALGSNGCWSKEDPVDSLD
jgi:dipeptidase